MPINAFLDSGITLQHLRHLFWGDENPRCIGGEERKYATSSYVLCGIH